MPASTENIILIHKSNKLDVHMRRYRLCL